MDDTVVWVEPCQIQGWQELVGIKTPRFYKEVVGQFEGGELWTLNIFSRNTLNMGVT